MANKINFKNRVETARSAAKFAKVLDMTRNGLARVVAVPGHDSKQYNVIIHRGAEVVQTECNLMTSGGPVPCQGNNGGHTVCYHSMAALVVAANKIDRKISFCQRKEDACRLAHANHGRPVRIMSRTATNGEIWAVAY